MFNKGSAYDLWWTGQEFKDMRIEACQQMLEVDEKIIESFKAENFDLAIGHFHDLCPLAIAEKINVKKVVWITHGTSVYDFTAVQTGLRTFPSFVPHPLSSYGDKMGFFDRIINVVWHLSTLDFVNLPQNLLYDENDFYRKDYLPTPSSPDLWDLSKNVRILLVNGERFLDFPRPLPVGITFMGEVGKSSSKIAKIFSPEINAIIEKAEKGLIIFSLGTVSNTTNMPQKMLNSFVEAFGQFPDYQILWRMEMNVPQASKYSNINLLKWLPQKDLMKHPKTRLLIAHGGYNSFLEASQAGIPIILMPLFADQFINAKRAKRFGISQELDKLNLTPKNVARKIRIILSDKRYEKNAKKLAAMLNDKPFIDPHAILSHRLKLAVREREIFALKSSQFFVIFSFNCFNFVISSVSHFAFSLNCWRVFDKSFFCDLTAV
jgi:glucuronosyltransferase